MNRESERAEERDLVLTHLQLVEFGRVIVFHGPEGIGKTWLLNKVKEDIRAKRPDTLIVRINCAVTLPLDPIEMLTFIRAQLSHAAQLSKLGRAEFLAFDLAALMYTLRARGEAAAAKLEADLAACSDSWVRRLLGKAAPVFGLVPVVGKAAEIAMKVSLPRLLREAREKQFHTSFGDTPEQNLIFDLEEMQPEDIPTYLPRLLAADIRALLVGLPSARLVFMLDRYQGLWGRSGEAAQVASGRFSPDAPLRELMAGLTDALFVVSNRNASVWAAEDLPGGGANVLYRELLPFTDAARVEFLTSEGVRGDEILRGVAHETGGHPIWLKRAAEKYRALAAGGEAVTPEQMHLMGDRRIVDTAGDGFDSRERLTMKVLATALWFDRKLFSFLVTEMETGVPPDLFTEITGRSYVTNSGPGAFSIHPAFRVPLLGWMRLHEPDLLARARAARDRFLSQDAGATTMLNYAQLVAEGGDAAYRILHRLGSRQQTGEELDAYIASEEFKLAHAAGLALQVEVQTYGAKVAKAQAELNDYARAQRELFEATLASFPEDDRPAVLASLARMRGEKTALPNDLEEAVGDNPPPSSEAPKAAEFPKVSFEAVKEPITVAGAPRAVSSQDDSKPRALSWRLRFWSWIGGRSDQSGG